MISTGRLKWCIHCNERRGTGWLLKTGVAFIFSNKIMIGYIYVFESKFDGLRVITKELGILSVECNDIAWIDSSLDFCIGERFQGSHILL